MRLQEKYKKEIAPELVKKNGYKNVMSVPKIKKVAINSGFGRLVVGKTNDEQKKIALAIADDLATICGQKPVLRKAKKSISTFKTRQGMVLGASVTLRGKKMYDFVERFVSIALPRSRDFRGIDSKGFDKNGNLTIGIKEHIIFPEISPEKSRSIFGFEVTVVTSAKNKEECLSLLKALGFPIKS